MKQEFDKYTSDDFDVWKILAQRQLKNLEQKAWSQYNHCLTATGLNQAELPRFSDLEMKLQSYTGWKIEVVKGIIPVDEFIVLLSEKRFCSSTWLRSRAQLDYLEEPDMFHDIFGHIPLLAHPPYARFVEEFAQLGKKFLHEPVALLLLERLYWFTIEFGLMKENNELKIFGAGILSSFGETNHIYSDANTLLPFSPEAVLKQPFRNNEVQQLYFAAENMSDIWNCLPQADQFISNVISGKIDPATLRLHEQTGSTPLPEHLLSAD